MLKFKYLAVVMKHLSIGTILSCKEAYIGHDTVVPIDNILPIEAFTSIPQMFYYNLGIF